jgi:hypothetical protein
MAKDKIIMLRADFVNNNTPNYITDISFTKVEGNPEYSRRIIELEGKTEREKLAIIFNLIDSFDKIVLFERKEN